MVEEANYATLKNLTDEDLELMEDEDSHYALVRQPDGKADEPEYSSLRYNIMFYTHFFTHLLLTLAQFHLFVLTFTHFFAHSYISVKLSMPRVMMVDMKAYNIELNRFMLALIHVILVYLFSIIHPTIWLGALSKRDTYYLHGRRMSECPIWTFFLYKVPL